MTTPKTNTTAGSVDDAIAEQVRGNPAAAEAHRLVAAARNSYGEVDPHGGHGATLAAAHVYVLLAIAHAVEDVAGCIERYVGGAR